MNPLMLSRIQFAANITFHILFPAISISLGWVLLYFKLRHAKAPDDRWQQAYQFWVKIFALCFALGVVSGVTMSFQFGTNWPGYMLTVGNIAGPLLAYEVMTAFFLEATFLGIMLFGTRRVSNGLHTLATFLVAFGTTVSAFWIIALNSWMHTPAGYKMTDGKAYVTSWIEVIFNPSMPYRFTHMLIASGLTTAFLLAGISAYRWLQNDRGPAVIGALRTGVFLAAILIPIQIIVGDLHGLNTLKYEPAKIAALESIWKTESGAGLRLFALPDEKAKTNHAEIMVPKLGSLILTHKIDGEIKGLNSFEAHPPVAPLFFGFRIMVGMGLLMLLVSWLGSWQLWKYKAPTKWLARGLVAMSFSGWIAVVAGWYVTEIGRQPWLVYGVLKTADTVAKLPAPTVATSLIMYLLIYAVLITAFIGVVFYLAKKAAKQGTESLGPANNVPSPAPVI